MTWQCQHGCLASSPCPDSDFTIALCKTGPLPASGPELGLNHYRPQLAWGWHDRRTTNVPQCCSVCLKEVSLARMPGKLCEEPVQEE